MRGRWILLFVLAFLGFCVAQIVAGYQGIEYYTGHIWAIAALIAAFVFRFTLPLTVGAFFGAMYVWGWPWIGALAFCAPGLIFVVPSLVFRFIGRFMNWPSLLQRIFSSSSSGFSFSSRGFSSRGFSQKPKKQETSSRSHKKPFIQSEKTTIIDAQWEEIDDEDKK